MRILTLLLLSTVAGAASADDAAMLRCRALADVAARAACYDAIPIGAAATASALAAPAPAAREAAIAAFGAPAAAAKERPLQSFETRIAGKFEGWEPGQNIKLANGQVWRVVDESVDTFDAVDPPVTVRRGLLGATFLDIAGAHRSPKVRRVQ
ncbi:hypothetical protein [Pseudoduganella namucuonensis]|uniref:Uncharacterized protein n=1 Tax=Pseudoduganella namucuonensis TaxID=1035707 RepID=A0A1I7KY54_9BURK|nr:hypothetical protein [Pseudoduganella namucuonensis]SFV02442.1 hypothetical protein SAMN05216552_10218 [Pseudoduganella namucuonensis]